TAGSWEVRNFSFTAQSAITTIRFTGTGDGVEFLDNVEITQLPPTVVDTYSLSQDFSLACNPNGVWSYGAKSNISGAFSLLNVHQTQPFGGSVIESWEWGNGVQPVVNRNSGTVTDSNEAGQ